MERDLISKGRKAAAARQAGCCKYCFVPFSVSPATAEHRVPRSKGGSNLGHNIDAACERCNKLKATMGAKRFVGVIKGTPQIGAPLELTLAWSRRRIWLKTHRVCRDIGRIVGMADTGPLGVGRAAA
ncbi:HNH endonuclease [Devosia elaeis]|uniref:HNH nuclease domain-containing protein n=1 Tax=Devosia elaeis TaxID=1770058 RepID=A0A178HKJ8_9HYPH|nr:HNH endonuclease [Devosia elaeis]OAM73049.1 hypothetical protein A3840_18700 [Devosia elaeis]